jgi:hypothetical protein
MAFYKVCKSESHATVYSAISKDGKECTWFENTYFPNTSFAFSFGLCVHRVQIEIYICQ